MTPFIRLAAALISALLAFPANGQNTPKADFDIPAQRLDVALQQAAQVQRVQILFSESDVKNLSTPGVKGRLSTYEAVQKLIEGTNLTAVSNESNAIAIRPRAATDKGGQAQNPTLLAQAQSAERQGVASQEQDRKAIQLEGIVVTAQKREERLQDVPVPVTAISGETLVERNQLRFQDYFSNFPGLSFGSGTRDDAFPAIRGLTTGAYTNPTVGTVLDDMPYGASIGSVPAPDLDPSDLERIEVLRGPQGTLYGASSLGGLIKYVTVDPSVRGFSGRAEAGMSSVRNGAQLGYSARGAVNVPISGTLAVRASGFTRVDPGYLDNPVRELEGVNKGHAAGGHLAALWKPSNDFSLKLSALIQRSDADGNSFFFVNPGFSDLQQNYLPGATGYERRDETFGATIKARLGSVDLTSISSYSNYDHLARADISVVFGALTRQAFGANFGGTYFADTLTVRKHSQEIRLSSSAGSRFDWRLGAFYTREALGHPTDYWAVDPSTLATQFFGHSDVPLEYRERAAFADLTFHLTERFNVQIGGRQSHIEQPESKQTHTGQFASARFGANPFVVNVPSAEAKPTTYLFTPQFKFNPDLMVYMRFASGFQPGGVNIGVNVPPTFGPNTTKNYEVGVKGSLPGRVLSFDLSLYRIDWKDLPTVFFNSSTSTTYRVNGGEARSEGVEASFQTRPLPGLTIGGWLAWSDAKLTKAVSPGVSGDRLPYSSRFSGNLSADHYFPLTDRVGGFAGIVWSYMGERLGNLGANRQVFPAYSKVDLRMGVDYESWKVNVFVNNATDKRGAIGGGLDAAFAPFPLLYIHPRTVGVSVSNTF